MRPLGLPRTLMLMYGIHLCLKTTATEAKKSDETNLLSLVRDYYLNQLH